MWIIFIFSTIVCLNTSEGIYYNPAPVPPLPVAYVPAYNYPQYNQPQYQPPQQPQAYPPRYPTYNASNNATANRNGVVTCMSHSYDLPGSHSGFFGCRNQTDKLLYSETISKPKRFFSAREKFIDYPGEVPRGHVRDDVISAIWCYDLGGYRNGGYCTIMNGGIGKKYVRIHIYHTERNLPLQYKVEIYGRANSTKATIH